MEKSQLVWRRSFLLAWAALALVKLGLALSLQPLGDEAFYWMEAQRPAWAYSDLPGFTAWLIALGGFAGEGLAGLRWPFLALGMLIPWQVVWLSRLWVGEGPGWLAGLLALFMPLTLVLGLMALPDVPLTVATLLCLHAAARLQHHVSAPALVQLGAGLAMGAFCHYRFAVVVAALALGLLLSGALPRLCRAVGFWLALAAGAVAWLPLLAFNLRHAGVGLSFQLVDRHPWQFQVEGMVQPLVQALFVSPLLYALLLLALWQAWQAWRLRGSGPAGLQFGFAAVPIFGYFLLGFFADTERVSFHWVLPAYLPLLARVALDLAGRHTLRRMTLASSAAISLLALAYLAAAAVPALAPSALLSGKWYPSNFSGWREIAQVVRRQSEPLPAGAVVVADNFMLAAQLEFALEGSRPVYALDHPLNRKHGRAAQLHLWERDDAALAALPAGTPVLFVAEQTATKPSMQPGWQRQWCARFGQLEPLGALSLHEGRKRFLVYRAKVGELPLPDCARPALARFYDLQPEQRLAGELELRGWAFKDGSGIEALQISLDGAPLVEARHGLPAAHVQQAWPESDDPGHPDVGFEARLDLSQQAPGRYRLGIRVLANGRWEEAHTLPVRVETPSAVRNPLGE